MKFLNIDFDFRKDSKCGDPDTDSIRLYEVHKFLWSKTLPCGETWDLEIKEGGYGRILLKNRLCGSLSSDRMCPHFVRKYEGKFEGWLTDIEERNFQHKMRTIGGHIIFPAHKKDGFTINQARGVNRIICDRFDLTLECIRRYYRNEKSPLYDTLLRYKGFFDLFVDFEGYTNFFLLQDFIDENKQIRFSLPFDNFERSALPQTIEEYKNYMEHTLTLIRNRNKRILER